MTPRVERALGLSRPLPLVRGIIADEIDRLIAMLDGLDPDPDIEANGDERDASFPFRSLVTAYSPHMHEDDEDGNDREDEDEHGGDVQDEPHDEEGLEADGDIAGGSAFARWPL